MKWPLLASLVAILTLYSSLARSQDYVILTEHYPPYIYQENDSLKGLALEVVEEALSRAGITKEITLYPFARTIRLAQNNEPLIAFPVMKSAERDSYFTWIAPVAEGEFWLYKLADRSHVSAMTLDDTRFYSIASVRGGRASELLAKKGFENIVAVTDVEQGINMLIRKNVDMLAMDKITANYLAKSLNIDIDKIEPVIKIDQIGQQAFLAASKSVPNQTIEKLKHVFNEMMSSGKYREIEASFIKKLESR